MALVCTCFTAFGIPGRARRVHPECHVVRHTRRGKRDRVGFAQNILEKQHPAQFRPLLCSGSRHHHRVQMRQLSPDGKKRRRERGGNHRRRRAAVDKQIGILLRGQQRVDGYRNDSGANRTPERDGKFDRVVQYENEPALVTQLHFPQSRREPVGAVLELSVSERTRTISEHHLAAQAASDIGVNKIGRGVVRTALQQVFQHRPRGRCHERLHPEPASGERRDKANPLMSAD